MRTWEDAERHLRREAAQAMGRRSGAAVGPLVAAVGGQRPAAVIALGGLDPDRPSRTVCELVLLAAAFRPERVLVATAVATTPAHRKGAVVAHEVLAVPDGLVEATRAWGWQRAGRRVLVLPTEVGSWTTLGGLEAEVARTIIEQRPACRQPALLRQLLQRSLAAGHRVRLACADPAQDPCW